MNLREYIRIILNEEVSSQVRRRHGEFDRIFKNYRDSFMNHEYRAFNSFWNTVLEVSLETLYHAWFSETVSDNDWEESAEYIENYLTKKYYNETKQIWNNKSKINKTGKDTKDINESELEQPKNKTQEFQKLIDDEIASMKQICRQMTSDDEDIISFDACDFIELGPKVIVTDVDKFYGKLRILVVIKYEAAMHFHDEESFIYELHWRLKWLGDVMIDVEDVINTYPKEKRQW